MPYLSASVVVINYEEALYSVNTFAFIVVYDFGDVIMGVKFKFEEKN